MSTFPSIETLIALPVTRDNALTFILNFFLNYLLIYSNKPVSCVEVVLAIVIYLLSARALFIKNIKLNITKTLIINLIHHIVLTKYIYIF